MPLVDQVAADDVAPLTRWRRVCARLDAGRAPEPDDATWLADACREAIEHGAPLREVFGLPARGGAGGLAHVARRAHRDELLRKMHAACFAHLGARPASREMIALAARQRRSSRVPRDEAERRIAELLKLADIPSERTLRQILGRPNPV